MKGKRRQNILIKDPLLTLVGKVMTTIFIFLLFITQIISFYFLVILYTKVSKQDEFERKQKQIMEEMDNSLAAYLAEVKDDNEKLLKKLTLVQDEKATPIIVEETELTKSEKEPDLEESSLINISTPKIPMNLALKSYGKMKQDLGKELEEEVELDDRARAIVLHNEGKSVEEIARTLGKGRTEVELILKFR